MNWQDQPEFRAAVVKEQFDRDAAFLGLNENIGEFEVVPMTLWHLLVLRVACSPFLSGQPPRSAQDIITFLWLLHPRYRPEGGRHLRRLARRCARYASPAMPWLHTRRSMLRYERRAVEAMTHIVEVSTHIRTYLADTFADWPAGKATGPSYYSDACVVCSILAREHHRTQEWVMRAPLKVVFQYLKEIRERHGKPLFNPSDKFSLEWMRRNQDPDSLLGKLLATKRN